MRSDVTSGSTSSLAIGWALNEFTPAEAFISREVRESSLIPLNSK
jgi:hypothetical protein